MPLHPGLVHYPIALTVLAAAFQLLALVTRRDSHTLAALLCLCGAGIGGILAALTGTGQEQLVAELPGIQTALEQHEMLGNLAAWLLAGGSLAAVYLFLKGRLRPWPFLVALVLASGLLVLTGHFGGRLVFEHGAGVAAPVPVETASPP
ncbi:MAG: DUF2231 domain-containing protein [Candidatus Neomarinimicrobiota bacterium]